MYTSTTKFLPSTPLNWWLCTSLLHKELWWWLFEHYCWCLRAKINRILIFLWKDRNLQEHFCRPSLLQLTINFITFVTFLKFAYSFLTTFCFSSSWIQLLILGGRHSSLVPWFYSFFGEYAMGSESFLKFYSKFYALGFHGTHSLYCLNQHIF